MSRRAHNAPTSQWMRYLRYAAGASLLLLVSFLLGYAHFFGPVNENDDQTIELTVAPETSVRDAAAHARTEGLVRSTWALRFAIHEQGEGRKVRPGVYKLRRDMDTWTVAKTLTDPPAIAFVTFPPGIRKEQMGEILADALNWSDAQVEEWNTSATSPDPDFIEGVYYPDTYLIPSDQDPAQVAARMRGRFTDAFAPYAAEAKEKGLEWTEVLTLASIVDREAAKNDKHIVAGILWNRIEEGMRLQADATLQYIRGESGNWWPQPQSADKFLASAFNTYQHAGLPPHPINNPSLASIEAVLNPESTSCMFYLHDANGQIHCSRTYAEHLQKIDAYLR
jgi:UPF0755 protein